MKPPHKHFFSSLKQVEKRLKLDNGIGNPQQTESLTSSPLYFHNQHTNTASTLHDEQPPQEFLSIHDFQSNPEPQLNTFPQNSDIHSMIQQLLRLSDSEGKAPEIPDFADDEFYDKIVKVKGPKCRKQVERLDNWINYLLNNGGREPFILAHLLLAKAAVVSVGGHGDRLDFPSTLDEFLLDDPPQSH